MEGRASTFEEVLADFESRLHDAEFVAIDTELTGVDIAGEPDTFEETAQMRIDKNCRIAERYSLIQLGLTLVGRVGEASEGRYTCASYNLFAFPYMGPEQLGQEPGFYCQASALQFNALHRVDFNKWIGDGIPYMTREDERRYFKTSQENGDSDKRSGLLRLWKALCAARLPFVVHCPLDLFFLLASFERRPLPRDDPRALAMMIKQCTPKVFDTAHLHSMLGHFKRLGLLKFFEDVKARYDELRESSNGLERVPPVEFKLLGATASRYSKGHDELAHEAGFDSFITAQLFTYLRAITPARVKEAANRLFMYRSVEYLDLESAVKSGEAAANIFDLSRVTLLVAALDPADSTEAHRLISAAGATCRWIDATHVLVVLRASGGAAVRKAGEMAAQVHGVVSWMGFDDWRVAQARSVSKGVTRPQPSRVSPNGCSGSTEGPVSSASSCCSSAPASARSSSPASARRGAADRARRQGGLLDDDDDDDDDRKEWSLGVLVAVGAAGALCSAILMLLLMRGNAQLERLLRRWRRR